MQNFLWLFSPLNIFFTLLSAKPWSELEPRRIYDNTHIFIDGTELAKVSHAKFLGVLIDESLTWEKHNSHVSNIVSKYSSILFRF